MVEIDEDEFELQFRRDGFLAPLVDAAIPIYVDQHPTWFDLLERLNRAGTEALGQRDDRVVGLTTQHPVCLATRMFIRTLGSLQGTILLCRRGMASEAEALIRGIYETAFWLGFLQKEPGRAAQAVRVDEQRSKLQMFKEHQSLYATGALPPDAAVQSRLAETVNELKTLIGNAQGWNPKDIAKAANLYQYYPTYKALSARSAHTSLHSLHRYLKSDGEGAFSGHILGPDMQATGEALCIAGIGFGICIAYYAALTGPAESDERVASLILEVEDARQRRHLVIASSG